MGMADFVGGGDCAGDVAWELRAWPWCCMLHAVRGTRSVPVVGDNAVVVAVLEKGHCAVRVGGNSPGEPVPSKVRGELSRQGRPLVGRRGGRRWRFCVWTDDVCQ